MHAESARRAARVIRLVEQPQHGDRFRHSHPSCPELVSAISCCVVLDSLELRAVMRRRVTCGSSTGRTTGRRYPPTNVGRDHRSDASTAKKLGGRNSVGCWSLDWGCLRGQAAISFGPERFRSERSGEERAVVRDQMARVEQNEMAGCPGASDLRAATLAPVSTFKLDRFASARTYSPSLTATICASCSEISVKSPHPGQSGPERRRGVRSRRSRSFFE
jgi:hypothetical protein